MKGCYFHQRKQVMKSVQIQGSDHEVSLISQFSKWHSLIGKDVVISISSNYIYIYNPPAFNQIHIFGNQFWSNFYLSHCHLKTGFLTNQETALNSKMGISLDMINKTRRNHTFKFLIIAVIYINLTSSDNCNSTGFYGPISWCVLWNGDYRRWN